MVIEVSALQCTDSAFIWARHGVASALRPVIGDYVLEGGLVLTTMPAAERFHLAGIDMSLDAVALELLTTLVNTRDLYILTAKP